MNAQKKIYFAHPVSQYGTKVESDTIKHLEDLGMKIINPNEPEHCEAYETQGMQYFIDLCNKCDGCIYTTFENGAIGAGVAKEIESFLERDLPVFLAIPLFIVDKQFSTLATQQVTLIRTHTLKKHCWIMGVEQTRAYLKEIGAR